MIIYNDNYFDLFFKKKSTFLNKFYEFGIGPYEKMKDEAKKRLFVERVEGTVASDINRFLQAKQQKDDDDDNPTDSIFGRNDESADTI